MERGIGAPENAPLETPRAPHICILDGIPKTDPLDSPIIRPEIPALRIGPKSRDM